MRRDQQVSICQTLRYYLIVGSLGRVVRVPVRDVGAPIPKCNALRSHLALLGQLIILFLACAAWLPFASESAFGYWSARSVSTTSVAPSLLGNRMISTDSKCGGASIRTLVAGLPLRIQRRGRTRTDAEKRRAMKALYINADVDAERRVGTLDLCRQLELECVRVVPPAINSPEVVACVEEAGMQPWQCSLVHAHRLALLKAVKWGGHTLILEDDARLNTDATYEDAKTFLSECESDDFVMGGWCYPSCSHAYVVSSTGASELLDRGFAKPRAPADCMFPVFESGKNWSYSMYQAGGRLLYPRECESGYNTDLGLFCQDRSTSHGLAYYMAELMNDATPGF